MDLKSKQRRSLIAIIVVCSAILLVGCNNSSNQTATNAINTTDVAVTSDAPTTTAPPETTTQQETTTTEEDLPPAFFPKEEVTLGRVGFEKLADRALTAVDLAGNKGSEVNVSATDSTGAEIAKGVYLSWRSLKGDDKNTTFTLYRNNQVVADKLTVTNYIDAEGKSSDIYKIVGSTDKELELNVKDTAVWANYYQEFALNTPAPQKLPSETVEFTANDMSLADLDGDGEYELVVKWYPDNGKDNSQAGVTGYTYLDGYDIDFATGKATQLWRIDLGPNIRSGAHYTQFMVWDMDNDGKAEVACKTADGSTAYTCREGSLVETGFVGACNSAAIPSDVIGASEHDYRTSSGKSLGYILKGPEYLTIFSGETGEIIDTIDYWPQRGTVGSWGDTYGNRVDRFLACVAYLDGVNPSMVFCRGYYTRVTLAAYQLVDGKLTMQWKFDSNESGNAAQGNHGISVADVDYDGKDEIIYGALVINDDGTALYNSACGHGDAMQVGDLLPSREGLEIFNVHEIKTSKYQFTLRDGITGEILFGLSPKKDVGRGLTGDIDPRYEGEELWSTADKNVYSAASTLENPIIVSEGSQPSQNFSIYWDGDLLRELQDYKKRTVDGAEQMRSNVTKWDYENKKQITLLETSEFLANVGTKEKMGIVADVVGDWREEIISRHATDRSKIRIYMSTIPTDYTVECLMQNNLYRLGTVWQNVAYNQPAHLSYALTHGLKTSVISVDNAVLSADNVLEATGSAEISFTAASDGNYGHKIEGYELYVKVDSGKYELLAEVARSDKKYRHTGLEAGKTYTYKVAAVVDGRTSYYSLPVSVKIK